MTFETSRDGFVMTVEGRRVLRHSPRSPCVEMGVAEHRVRQNRGSFALSRGRVVPVRLSNFRLVFRGSDRTVVEFDGGLSMIVTYREAVLRMGFESRVPGVNHFRIRLGAHRREHIYGCGEQYSRLDLKGSTVPLWVEEQGVGRGCDAVTLAANLWSGPDFRAGAGGNWHTTSYPVPAFVSSANYWAVVDTKAHTVFDFGRDSTRIECWEIPPRISMGFGARATGVLSAVSGELLRQPKPPDWVYDGAWLGMQGGTAEILRKTEAALAAGARVGAVWVQDWCGRRNTSFGRQIMWNWSADRDRYPDLGRTIAELRRRGIRFLGYINPFLAVEGEQYAEASRRGYCVKRSSGEDYLVYTTTFPAAMVDLTNPEARGWLRRIIVREMLGIGMSGWMADFGEYLPADAVLHSGEDARLVHNTWPVLWTTLNRDAIREWASESASRTTGGSEGDGLSDRAQDIHFFVRSGWLRSGSAAPGVWAADQLVTFSKHDGLPSVIPAAISMGFSGVGHWHSDVGGYTTVGWLRRGPRCLARWMETAAFTPLYRTHEGNRPDRNVQFWSDRSMLALLARTSELYAALKHYHRVVAEEYSLVGLPPIRHPYLHYEADEALHARRYQYLYGRDLFVAPVLDGGSGTVDLYLPSDRWVHLWTSREFGGGPLSIEAPFGYPAVFYRAASEFAPLFDAIRRTVRRV